MTNPSEEKMRVFSGVRAASAVLAVTLPLWSCSDGMTGPSDIAGGAWKLQSMEFAGAARFVPDNADLFTVEFHADGLIGVVADCNQCGGTYSVGDGTLTVPPMACTLVLCPTPQGGQFASLIDGTSSLDREGETELEIESPEGKVVLRR
jgi:heat shock protein HslJ